MKHQRDLSTGRLDRARRAALALTLTAAGLAGSGCAAISGGGSKDVASDVLEIKQQLQARNEAAEAEQRKMDFRLQSLDEKVQTRTEILQNNLDEALRSQREQTEAINRLRQQVEDLTYQVARNGGIGGSGGSYAPTGSMTTTAPAASDAAQTAPATSGSVEAAAADTTDGAYNEGLKQYNLGKYTEAAAAFEQVAAAATSVPDRRAQATYWLAESAFRQDELARSETAFRSLIEQAKTLDPNSSVHAFSWRAVERLAQIKQRQGDNAKAIYYYKYILQTNPGYESADRIRAEVEALEGAAGATAPAEAAPDGAPPPADTQPMLDRTHEGA